MKLPDVAPSDRTAPGRVVRHRRRLWRRRFNPRGFRTAGVIVCYAVLVWLVCSLPHREITRWLVDVLG